MNIDAMFNALRALFRATELSEKELDRGVGMLRHPLTGLALTDYYFDRSTGELIHRLSKERAPKISAGQKKRKGQTNCAWWTHDPFTGRLLRPHPEQEMYRTVLCGGWALD
jgi:hypothetical protein